MNKNYKKIIYIALPLVFIGIIVLSNHFFAKDTEIKDKQALPKTSQETSVKAIVISPKPLENKIVVNGTIIGNEEVELHSEVSGKITKIYFKEGSRVRQGDVLLKINDDELQAALKKLSVKQEMLKNKENRQRILLEKQGTSQENYDEALSELNSLYAEIEYYKVMIEKTEIKASFDGIIGLKSVSQGSYVTPATKIATIQSVNPVKIDFSIPQKYYSYLKQTGTINFTELSKSRQVEAKIYAIEPKIDPSTRTIQVRAICPNPKGEFVPGSFVTVELMLGENQNAIMIPSDVIVPDVQGQIVYVIRSGKATPVIVETGIRTEKEVEILKGLSSGDTLVGSAIIQMKSGLAVKIENVEYN